MFAVSTLTKGNVLEAALLFVDGIFLLFLSFLFEKGFILLLLESKPSVSEIS